MALDLPSLGWDEHFTLAYRHHDRPDQFAARVARVDPGVCGLLTAAGSARASLGGGLLAAAARTPARRPCVGDWVVVRRWCDGCSTIEDVLPRRTSLVGPSVGSGQPGDLLASNVDTVAVIVAADREAEPIRLRKLLTLARDSGTQPIVLLTTVDGTGRRTSSRGAAVRSSVAQTVAEIGGGADVYGGDDPRSPDPRSPDPWADLFGAGRTVVLIGGPAAHRSRLVDRLAGATVLRRGDSPDRGLVILPGGGVVIDTPEITFGLAARRAF